MMPVHKKATNKCFNKEIISKGYGFHTPQDGSVCKIKILSDESKLLKDLDDDNTKEIVIGDVDESIDIIIENCLRSMKEEEICLLKFQYPFYDSIADNNESEETSKENDNVSDLNTPTSNDDNVEDNNKQNLDTNITSNMDNEITMSNIDIKETIIPNSPSLFAIELQLLAYTREPEIWEMSVTEKWRRASFHKQRGLELYARGAYQHAFRRFGLTLKYVISLEHDIPSCQEEGMDIQGLKLSCYLNVAACQMRHHNYESVVINSTKALALQPNTAKALYRRGTAYLQLQEYEKAKEDLSKAQELEPKNQAILKQQQLLKSKVQKLNQYYAAAMKKMFT